MFTQLTGTERIVLHSPQVGNSVDGVDIIGLSAALCRKEDRHHNLIYVRVASRNRTLGTLKRNGFFDISEYLHAFCTILQILVDLGASVTKK